MAQYRILTNGHTFKIQRLATVGVFRRRQEWRDLGQYLGSEGAYFVPTEYKTRKEAQKQADEWLNKENVSSLPWIPA